MKPAPADLERPQHLTVPCPYCGAAIGESCFRKGSVLRGALWVDLGFRVYKAVHKKRRDAAERGDASE